MTGNDEETNERYRLVAAVRLTPSLSPSYYDLEDPLARLLRYQGASVRSI